MNFVDFHFAGCPSAEVIEALGVALLAVDIHSGRILDANPKAAGLFGYERSSLVLLHFNDLLANGHLVWEEPDADFEVRFKRRGSNGFDGSTAVSERLTHGGRTMRLLAVRDISETKRALRAAEHSEHKFASLFDVSPDAMIVSDIQTGLVASINPSFTSLFGYTPEDIIGRRTTEVGFWPSEDDRLRAVNAMTVQGALRNYEAELCSKDGRTLTVLASSGRVMINGRAHWVVQFRDISERKAHLRMMEHLAHHDALTGLPNRHLLFHRLESALVEAALSGRGFALMVLDLDGFKEVNDALGHPVGDQLLQMVSARLTACLEGENTLLARLGGDEFAIIVTTDDRSRLGLMARSLCRIVRSGYVLSDMRMDISVSVGISRYPDDGTDAATLLRRADVAMYVAKRTHTGWGFYDPASDLGSVERLALMGQLKEAIRNDELRLHWQPRVSLATGTVVGAEGLVRWQHPVLGMLSPGIFVPAAEMSSLITALTDWVVTEAARQVAIWNNAGIRWPVSVNLSARNLADDELPERLELAMASYGIAPGRIQFEITETAFMSDPDRAFRVLETMVGRGNRFAIDDFGTGYASLSTLRLLPPVTALKIDRSFVGRMTEDAADAAVVETIIGLAKRLGIDSVAEGVENEATYRLLCDMQCSEAQGYWIARPAAAAEMVRHMERWRP